MLKRAYKIPLKVGQTLRFFFIGDVHWDTEGCDKERVERLVEWCLRRERQGELVRIGGTGDYLDFGSPSERRALASGALHETTAAKFDAAHFADLREFVSTWEPLRGRWLGLLSGHHEYLFATRKAAGQWKGRSSDEWLAHQFGCDYWGDGVAFFRLLFPHGCYLDVLAYHGSGSAQTPGGRVQKRIRVAEIAPNAHIVAVAHDNQKLAFARSGLDFDHGSIKRYVIGVGSMQRAYMEGVEAGYAEKAGLVPADLGVTIFEIRVEKRNGQYRVDYHSSV